MNELSKVLQDRAMECERSSVSPHIYPDGAELYEYARAVDALEAKLAAAESAEQRTAELMAKEHAAHIRCPSALAQRDEALARVRAGQVVKASLDERRVTLEFTSEADLRAALRVLSGMNVCDRLGIDVKSWAADIRARVAAHQSSPAPAPKRDYDPLTAPRLPEAIAAVVAEINAVYVAADAEAYEYEEVHLDVLKRWATTLIEAAGCAGPDDNAARALLRRIVKYAVEDRAYTPGTTRLARAILEARRFLGIPDGAGVAIATHQPPLPEAIADVLGQMNATACSLPFFHIERASLSRLLQSWIASLTEANHKLCGRI